jgi:hypothetical protein
MQHGRPSTAPVSRRPASATPSAAARGASGARPLTAKSRAMHTTAPITLSLDPAERVAAGVRHYKAMLLKRPVPATLRATVRPTAATGGLQKHQTVWSQRELRERFAAAGALGRGPSAGSRKNVLVELEAFSERHNLPEDTGSANRSPGAPPLKAKAKKAAPAERRKSRFEATLLRVTVASGESLPLRYMLAYGNLAAAAKPIAHVQLRRLVDALRPAHALEDVGRASGESMRVMRLAAYNDRAAAHVADAALRRGVYTAFDMFDDAGWVCHRPLVMALESIVGGESRRQWLQFFFAVVQAHGCGVSKLDYVTAARHVQGVRARGAVAHYWAAEGAAAPPVKKSAMTAMAASALAVTDAEACREFAAVGAALFPPGGRDYVSFNDLRDALVDFPALLLFLEDGSTRNLPKPGKADDGS